MSNQYYFFIFLTLGFIASFVYLAMNQMNKKESLETNQDSNEDYVEITNTEFSFEDQEKYFNSIYQDYEAIEYVEELKNPTPDQLLRIYASIHIKHKKEFPLHLKQYLAKLKEAQLEEVEFTQGMLH